MSADEPAINGGSGPVTDQPPPGHAPAQLPAFAQDLELVLNIAFCEQFAGFERMEQRAPDGSTLWHERQGKSGQKSGQPKSAAELPPIKGTQYALIEWLDRYCGETLNPTLPEGAQALWSMQRSSHKNPEGASMYVAAVHLQIAGRPLPTAIGKGACDDPAVAIASAMLQVSGIGPEQLAEIHRELFAHRYLAT